MADEGRKENPFEDLTATAKRVLHQHMIGDNSKLAVSVAQDVLDRAGQTKKVDQNRQLSPTIVITNSQVGILAKVAEEVEAKLVEDDLYVPDSKELENGTEG